MAFFEEIVNVLGAVVDSDNLQSSCVVLGDRKIHIEGILKILMIDTASIIVLVSYGKINIVGTDLIIVNCQKNEISITGNILSINFERKL